MRLDPPAHLYLGPRIRMLARYGDAKVLLPSGSSLTICNQISPSSIVSDACVSYAALDELNNALFPILSDLTQTTDFFAYYRLNLFNKACPFWDESNGMCGNIACAVATLDNEEDIPPIWRAESLGKLEGPSAGHPGRKLQAERSPEKPLQGMLGEDVGESCVLEYDDECDERDFCVPDDEAAGAKGDYVSLVDNLERFTGYSGDGARQIWDAIYRENCFSRSSFSGSVASVPGLFPGTRQPAARELKDVLKQHVRQEALLQTKKHAPLTPFVAETGFESEDECLEKRVFYRIISGMHTSISAHICRSYLNQTTGDWGINLQCYKDRLHEYPERIANLYFNYAVVLRAVTKLGPSLQTYTFCSGDPEQDIATKNKVRKLTERAAAQPQIFDEKTMFVNGEGPSLKEDFRNRFRNISRIMDCVGCDKCRLWGKLQTAGYGAALKVLFESDAAPSNNQDQMILKRTELVALFNTLDRISNSLQAIETFRSLMAQEAAVLTKDQKKSTGNALDKDSADDFADHEAETVRLRRERLERLRNRSIKDAFRDEFILVWRTSKYVLRGWLGFPRSV